ncbi:hypothetical protein ATCC90586_002420 [Pythium insidiosum]|nr:hypothetical protein ATCC90586_002420 [Pythium insidiosum]
MPLTPRYTWKEDVSSIALEVALPGTSLKHVDIYLSDLVVKLNAERYVLLLDLFDRVEDTAAVVKHDATTHVVQIRVPKCESKLWGTLCCEEDKAKLKLRRLESMERKREAEIQVASKRKERKHDEERQTLRAQMAVEDTNRQILADLKAEEKEREERAMYETFRELQMQREKEQQAEATPRNSQQTPVDNQEEHRRDRYSATSGTPKPILKASTRAREKTKKSVTFAGSNSMQKVDGDGPKPKGNQQANVMPAATDEVLELGEDGSYDIALPPAKSIWSSEEVAEDEWVEDGETEDNQQPHEAKPDPKPTASHIESLPSLPSHNGSNTGKTLPAPRARAKVEITFTPRVFPTPTRESKAAEEEDWLLKNRKHLKKHKGLNTSDYDISESDPMWLKAKADDFYRSRDYRSAVNAYSEAIGFASEGQDEVRVTCLSNRAACFLQLAEFEKCMNDSLCRLGKITEAKADYGVALTMDGQNDALKEDYFQLVLMEKAEQNKRLGDECFQRNELDDAIKYYSESLRVNPQSIACLSNRAAAYLRRHDHQSCVDDCTQALTLLQQEPGASGEGHRGLAFFAAGPAPGTAKRREWVVKTMVRRGTAYLAMKMIERAEKDYAAAVELDPNNSSLADDLDHIRQSHKPNATAPSDKSRKPELAEAP